MATPSEPGIPAPEPSSTPHPCPSSDPATPTPLRPSDPGIAGTGDASGDDAGGHRLHPLSIVFGVLVNPLEIVPIIVLLAATGLWRWLPLVLLGALAVRAAQWRARQFSFDGHLLRLDEGVLQRSIRRLPVDRVQEVELVRSLRHQVLGVTTVLVQSAGDVGSAEIELSVLGRMRAEALRDEIVAARDEARAAARREADPTSDLIAATPIPGASTVAARPAVAGETVPPPVGTTAGRSDPPTTTLVHLDTRRLALSGVTGAQLAAVVVVVGWVANVLDDLPDELVPDIDAERLLVADLLLIAGLALGVIALWIGAAVAAGIVSNWDLTLTITGDDLKLRRGLLNRRETIIPLGRLQVAAIVANPARRLLGYADLHVRSAGSMDEQRARAVIPMLREHERADLLARVLPGADPGGDLVPAPPAARTRQIVDAVGPALPVALAFAVIAVWWRPAAGLWALVLVAGVATGIGRYRALGHRVDAEVAVIRSGALTRTLRFVPLAKIQSARASQSLLQRRRGLATLHLDVGGLSSAPTVLDQHVELVERLATVLPTRWWTQRRAGRWGAPGPERRTDPHPGG